MLETPGASKQEIKLFYCYAHEDKALRDELQVNLAGLRRQYHLTNWYDRDILPGAPWEEAIDQHLSTADIILLLISPHFVDSDYCYGKEMQRALERHHAGSCCVIPILIRPTYWEDTPLSAIQMLPTDAKPITIWPNRDEAFHDVARGIGIAIKALLTPRTQKSKEQWVEEGDALFELNRHEEALATYEKALHLDPTFAPAYHNKGAVLHDLKRYKEALTAYDQAIRLDSNFTRAYSNKGAVLHDLKRYEEALTTYDQAIRLSPNNAHNYNNWGCILHVLKRYEEALTAYDQAIRLDPNLAVAYHNKGNAFSALRRRKEAQQAFATARQLGYNG